MPGLRDVVQDDINGFLVDLVNTKGFVEALEKLIVDVDLRRSMGQAGYRLVKEHFSIEQCARLYEESLLKSPLNWHNKYTQR